MKKSLELAFYQLWKKALGFLKAFTVSSLWTQSPPVSSRSLLTLEVVTAVVTYCCQLKENKKIEKARDCNKWLLLCQTLHIKKEKPKENSTSLSPPISKKIDFGYFIMVILDFRLFSAKKIEPGTQNWTWSECTNASKI